MNPEKERLREAHEGRRPWYRWGPYLSERQWGTVREDYSPYGTAWEYFPHDAARSRAYRWGEDGIGGFSDDRQFLCLSVALWNGLDPILKERLFGLTGNEGNHGEDVKELYYYLDATPTHSYLKMLYKYPQSAYPYDRLVGENRARGKDDPEFELIDTGVFDQDRYFDVFVEYAKADPEDILLKVTAHNRGPEPAELHLLPQVWFRNTWSWQGDGSPRPLLSETNAGFVEAVHATLGAYRLDFDGAPELLFCDNDTNARRLYGAADAHGHFKDAFHDYVVHGRHDAVNPQHAGTKCAGHYRLSVPAGGAASVRVRLSRSSGPADPSGGRQDRWAPEPFADFEEVFARRAAEADAFYAGLQQGIAGDDAKSVHRQALAGMLWSKQFYYYDVPEWLDGDPAQPPPPPERRRGRNRQWEHLNNADVVSMPDKWEYPWYAAWDLAFHCVPLALVDAEFAKGQLLLLTREWYMHPNGQLPAYEWALGDANPPVHAWAAWRVYQIDRKQTGRGDTAFLERVFHKLLLNFTWWVNRKDFDDRNVFQGGFLGLDNIGVFDRNAPVSDGSHLDQTDGTAWMAMYCLNLLQIALELAMSNRVYEDIATKFFEHFLYIARAMNDTGVHGVGLWDEQDDFYYDVLRLPSGKSIPLKIRSMVGLTPLFAVETIEPEVLRGLPGFAERLEWFLNYRPELAALVSRWHDPGRGDRRLLSLLRGHRIKCLLRRLLDPAEFLSDYGVRALSKYHLDHPYHLHCDGQHLHCYGQPLTVTYRPAESDSHLFGGNSNWRGPVWFPVNYLLIEALQKFHYYYGDDFTVECPTGSGRYLTLDAVAAELSRRLAGIFLKDAAGRRAVNGQYPRLQTDPHFRDHILFYEYFHGDNGRGVGASHQTGWTGVVAKLLHPRDEPIH